MSASSWHERFETAKPTYTRVNDKKFADLEAGTTVLIPSPADIQREIDGLDAGEKIELTELRDRLADRHGADGACPVMTGMNLRVVAEVCLEALDAGVLAEDLSPVWNVVSPNSNLASKLPGGPQRIERLRAQN